MHIASAPGSVTKIKIYHQQWPLLIAGYLSRKSALVWLRLRPVNYHEPYRPIILSCSNVGNKNIMIVYLSDLTSPTINLSKSKKHRRLELVDKAAI